MRKLSPRPQKAAVTVEENSSVLWLWIRQPDFRPCRGGTSWWWCNEQKREGNEAMVRNSMVSMTISAPEMRVQRAMVGSYRRRLCFSRRFERWCFVRALLQHWQTRSSSAVFPASREGVRTEPGRSSREAVMVELFLLCTSRCAMSNT